MWNRNHKLGKNFTNGFGQVINLPISVWQSDWINPVFKDFPLLIAWNRSDLLDLCPILIKSGGGLNCYKIGSEITIPNGKWPRLGGSWRQNLIHTFKRRYHVSADFATTKYLWGKKRKFHSLGMLCNKQALSTPPGWHFRGFGDKKCGNVLHDNWQQWWTFFILIEGELSFFFGKVIPFGSTLSL